MSNLQHFTIPRSQMSGFGGGLPLKDEKCVLFQYDIGVATFTKPETDCVLVRSSGPHGALWNTEDRVAFAVLTPVRVQRSSMSRLAKIETDNVFKGIACVAEMLSELHPHYIRRLAQRDGNNGLVCTTFNYEGYEIGTISIEKEPAGWCAWTHVGFPGGTDCIEGEIAETSSGAFDSLKDKLLNR